MHEDDLEAVIRDLKAMAGRFHGQGSAGAPCLNSADRAAFKRLMLETKGLLSADLGPLNDFAVPLLQMTNLPGYGVFDPPTPEQLQEATALVEGGVNQVHRKQNRASAASTLQQLKTAEIRSTTPTFGRLGHIGMGDRFESECPATLNRSSWLK